ncbi:hypothetical protein CAPTEDRAFT_210950 [Capitella teleta]|uniref:Endonuclease/exonuclease/phosphatase domain-containing protein n=1 Tax=Capitella teleta TaxID=283909 RepID=R7TMI0_CAPTE|nr:hypothetical protein CAPTEDRAFT_210950 [Capitella teleta]|eukprot:ELT95073.1 hypothetical protein CAPTEDRAFT_210950 [Capitella teleta]
MESVYINSTLTYMISNLENATREQIRQACLSFYTADELLEAKNLLWDAANNDIIGRNTVRRNTVRGSETLKIFDDIFDALTSLNNLDATPKFAVGPEQLNRMPKASANEALPISICERINCLETQMRQLMEQMIAPKHMPTLSYSEAVQSSQHQWPNPPNPPQPQRPRAPRVSQPTHQHTVMHAVSTNAEAHESSPTDGFQKARNKRRKRKKALIGANEDSSLGLANEPSRSVFVARFPKETKTESIAQYATKNGITVRKVERMSKEDAPQASFRVMVKESDMMSIYNAEFWPKNILVAKFFGGRRSKPSKEPQTEHWFHQNDIHKLSRSEDYVVTGVSAMDSAQLHTGRPFGGCAFMYKRNWNCTLQPVDSNDISTVDYSYVNDFSAARSLIDHFLVSENVYDGIRRYGVRHDGDNLSDHCPILLELSIDVQYSAITETRPPNRKPSWHRAKSTNLLRYREILRAKLHALAIPVDALACNEFECGVHSEVLRNYYSEIMNAIISSAERAIPKQRKRALAGWSEYVSPYKEKAMFWHRIWSDSGRARHGWLHSLMLSTKREYKRVSRWVVRNQDKLMACRMSDSLSTNKSRDLWSEIKRIKEGVQGRTNIVDGRVGESEICDVFHDGYEHLYQSVPSDQSELEELKREFSAEVDRTCKVGLCYCDHVISPRDIEFAVRKLKPEDLSNGGVVTTVELEHSADADALEETLDSNGMNIGCSLSFCH